MDDLIKQIDTIIEDGLNNKAYPGGQYALVSKDKVHISHFGYKSLDPLIKADGSEVYDVASLTKVISTSTLAHLLIYKGYMSYETYVIDILPDFPHKDIQIKDLLAHTSGLPAYIFRGDDLSTRKEVIKAIYQTKLVYQKNSKVVYSCVGFIVLGIMMEKIMNTPLDKLAEKYIFKPLKMNNSNYHANKDLAAPTEYRDDLVYKGYLVGKVHDGLAYAMQGVSGNAGLFSTASDLTKFVRAILNEEFIYPKEVIDKMFASYIRIQEEDGVYHRSLGWAKPANDKDTIIYHTGFTGCMLVIDRKQKLGFIMLTNGIHPKREKNNVFPYRNKINKILFGF